MSNFNKIFWKYVPCDNIKNHKKPGFSPPLAKTALEKPQSFRGK